MPVFYLKRSDDPEIIGDQHKTDKVIYYQNRAIFWENVFSALVYLPGLYIAFYLVTYTVS